MPRLVFGISTHPLLTITGSHGAWFHGLHSSKWKEVGKHQCLNIFAKLNSWFYFLFQQLTSVQSGSIPPLPLQAKTTEVNRSHPQLLSSSHACPKGPTRDWPLQPTETA